MQKREKRLVSSASSLPSIDSFTRHRSGAVCEKKRSRSTNTTHVAGSSTTRCVEGCVPQVGIDVMSWQNSAASKFKLRVGPNYKKTNAKAPSGESLYELVALDLIRCSKDKMFNVACNPNFVLPAIRSGIDPDMKDIKRAGVPRLFIVNAQIPEKAPSVIGKAKDDPGYSLIFYFSVKMHVINELLSEKGPSTPAIRLLYQYVHEHETNPEIRRRFKAIGMAETKDLKIPGVGPLIDNFNGKPAIINKVAEIFSSGSDMDWLEVDISVFDFPFLAKRGLASLKDRVAEIGLRAGFVFQGETDEELPETLLGGGDCCIDFAAAKVF